MPNPSWSFALKWAFAPRAASSEPAQGHRACSIARASGGPLRAGRSGARRSGQWAARCHHALVPESRRRSCRSPRGQPRWCAVSMGMRTMLRLSLTNAATATSVLCPALDEWRGDLCNSMHKMNGTQRVKGYAMSRMARTAHCSSSSHCQQRAPACSRTAPQPPRTQRGAHPARDET